MERFQGKRRLAGQLLSSLLAALGISAVLLLLLAFVLLKFQPDMGTTETGILVVYVLSALAGGWYCGRKTVQRKFLWGALTGVLYFLVLLAISGMSTQPFEAGVSQSAIAFLLCAGAGMLGGMLA